MFQFALTPSAGKRLIGKAMARHQAVIEALADRTLIIIAGTTNGYAAEEILAKIGQSDGFSRQRFFRGVTLPPQKGCGVEGRLPDGAFPGDVVISKGQWQKGKTLFDVLDNIGEGDVILKGANAVNLAQRQAAILIGHPKGGTIVAALQAVIGRRAHLILPVGLEKRIAASISELAMRINAPGAGGWRFMPAPGEVFTEIEAIRLLTGADSELIAGGGVGGAEGAVWLAIRGSQEQEQRAHAVLAEVAAEPAFAV